MGQGQTGRHKHTYDNGDTFEGDFVRGKRHGNGVYISTAGARYEGEWQVRRRGTGERRRLAAASALTATNCSRCRESAFEPAGAIRNALTVASQTLTLLLCHPSALLCSCCLPCAAAERPASRLWNSQLHDDGAATDQSRHGRRRSGGQQRRTRRSQSRGRVGGDVRRNVEQ